MTTLSALLLTLAELCGMLLCLEAGMRIGLKRIEKSQAGIGPGFGALEGAVFGLLGLLVAFTFSGAAVRFDTKRNLIVDEANAIGTAYLRIDLLPPALQPPIREAFRQYVDAHIAVSQKMQDIPAANEEIARAVALQHDIWVLGVNACREMNYPARESLILSSFNEMFDIASARIAAGKMYTPRIILVLLATVSLVCSFLAGFDAAHRKTRSWVHTLGFAIILALTFYVIVDLEYPRVGLIRISSMDQVLVDLRATMN